MTSLHDLWGKILPKTNGCEETGGFSRFFTASIYIVMNGLKLCLRCRER